MPNDRKEVVLSQGVYDWLMEELMDLRQMKVNFDKVYEVLEKQNNPMKDLLDLIKYGDKYKELRD